MQLILASASPRRKELLGLFHIPFTIRVADIDETMDNTKSPFDEVARVSRLKAEAIIRDGDDVVVAADTIVVCQGKILGKPADEAEAYEMLRLLSGREHRVYTGGTLLRNGQEQSRAEESRVFFRELSEEEIRGYVATGEPMDKAGAYGIQGGAALFAEKLCGDYFNVVGLPISYVYEVLKVLLK